MNLILLYDSDYISKDTVVIRDRRFQHITLIQKPQVGDSLRVGLLNGQIGQGTVLQQSRNDITLQVRLDKEPPAALPCTLLLALPRPKMLKRVLQSLAAMGIKDIYLINTYRVDKSYWGSPILEQQINEQLLLGLEQAGDTLMPTVHLRKRFKPFVEDELPDIAKETRALVAHPYNATPCPAARKTATTLAIGPEGGFIPYEVEKLNECGFESIHIGQRILRVETAVPALLSRLFPV
ncbi:MAG: 16S rRNA (uracil(1498)-N(3))-methyltransferase [Neptuniibacter caesariensis]|uniref:Ribosomal RNA small subunit methyltransferase E n=1 Tax=Neptuniibacter caesariensis TaxID=207954 RepID=A0A2G6JRN3_NEPCE|nr:MAG: 16S rRNA (uracil(1498)-N(3))-methyltransferase [Neptuniibacter caesariensis]